MPKRVIRLFNPGTRIRPVNEGGIALLLTFHNAHGDRQTARCIHGAQSFDDPARPDHARLNWESIFQAIGSPTLILDTSFNILHANRAATSATGKSAEQLRGKKCFTVFHSPDHKQQVKGCPMASLLATSQAQAKEMEVETLGGTYLVSCTPVLDEKSAVSQIIHIATPITEHKRVANELERQNRFLTQLNEFAIKLSHLGDQSDLEAMIATELQKISGAVVLTISKYDPGSKCLYVTKLQGDSWILNQVNRTIQAEVGKIPSPLSDKEYQEIISEQVGVRKSLHDASFGGVSKLVSGALGRLLNIKHYLGIAYVCDNRLFGTSLLAMQKGTPDPPFEILRTFGQLAALALQRKQASEALRESEDKYRQLIETMSEGVVVVDNDDVIQFVNPAACKMYGYREQDLTGQTGYKLLVDESDWDTVKYKNTLRQNGITDSYLVRGKKLSGDLIWIRISGTPILDKSGAVAGSVGILSDVTQLKQNEEALLMQNAYLDELIEGAAEGIVVLDNDEVVLRVNKEFTRIFGYSLEEARGKRINDLIVPDHLRDEGWNATSTVARGDRVYFETVRKHKNGSLIDVSVLGNPIRLENNQIGVYGIYRDITDRKKLEEQLHHSQRLDSIGHLAGGVAHDFNNMLTVILGYGEQLLDAFGPGHPLRKDVGEILNAGNRALKLTNQLLAFGRKQMIRPQVISLNQVIDDMHSMLERIITEDIEIETVLSPDLHDIKADTSQIEQVIMNLVINACEAMPRGGKLSIQTTNDTLVPEDARIHAFTRPGEYVLLCITDTGIGMDKETLTRIFEPFHSTKDRTKSTGLGLATVYGIVKQADGYIWVYSEPKHGTSFKILFPACFDVREQPPHKSLKPLLNGGGQQVLVVEDEDMLRDLITTIIQKLGYSVTAVSNGEEALEIVREKGLEPVLTVTDVVMPGINGKELADLLCENHPERKVLFMSGYTESIIAHRGIIDDSIQFIQKPFTQAEMAEKIQHLLGIGN